MKLICYFQILAALAISLPSAMVRGVDFEKDIQPILKDHCFKCHSGPKAKKKIRYDDVRYLKELIGDHEEAVIVPGNPDASKLVKLSSLPQTSTDAMPPPRRGEPLNSAEKALIRKWVLEGAILEPSAEVTSTTPPEPAPAPDPNKIHVWTNTQGKTLNAAFVSANGTLVTLRKEDGEEVNYPVSLLSQESKTLAETLAR